MKETEVANNADPGGSLDRRTKRKREHSLPKMHHNMGLQRPSSGGSNSTTSTKGGSRLDKLATPRPSSSWKKPIKSKFSRGKENQLNRETHESKTNRRRDAESMKPSRDVSASVLSSNDEACREYDYGKDEISLQVDDNDCSYEGDQQSSRSAKQPAIPDFLTTPIISTVINHSYESSCPPPCVVKHAVHSLHREVMRLAAELADKDEYISKLEAKIRVRENGNGHQDCVMTPSGKADALDSSTEVKQLKQDLSAEVKRLSKVTSPELEPWTLSTKKTQVNEKHIRKQSIGSISPIQYRQDSFGDFVRGLSGELDSKLEEIEELDQRTNPEANMLPDNQAQVKELVKSLHTLRKECSDLRRASEESIKLTTLELDRNYGKIMMYVNEEMESVREDGIDAANTRLKLELEQARLENSRLETELISIREAAKTCGCKHESQPSPVPTEESWSEFCLRIRQALMGEKETVKSTKRKLDYNATMQVGSFFRELTFQEEIFVDAASEDLLYI